MGEVLVLVDPRQAIVGHLEDPAGVYHTVAGGEAAVEAKQRAVKVPHPLSCGGRGEAER